MNKDLLYFHIFHIHNFYFGLLWTNKGLVSSTISNNSKSLLKYFYKICPKEKFQYFKSNYKHKKLILDYFNGIRVNLNFPIDASFLSPWQLKISRIVSKIVYGKCVSYKDIAMLADKPYASRAVGNALKSNKLLVIVPCHRVINNNGNLGGFSKGLKLKKYLLSLEKRQIPALVGAAPKGGSPYRHPY